MSYMIVKYDIQKILGDYILPHRYIQSRICFCNLFSIPRGAPRNHKTKQKKKKKKKKKKTELFGEKMMLANKINSPVSQFFL